jgi:hypothetical protein
MPPRSNRSGGSSEKVVRKGSWCSLPVNPPTITSRNFLIFRSFWSLHVTSQ